MNSLTPFCPRCGGRMERVSDLFGEYDGCLNCGYHLDVFVGPPIALKPAEVPGKRTRRRGGRGPSMGGHTL